MGSGSSEVHGSEGSSATAAPREFDAFGGSWTLVWGDRVADVEGGVEVVPLWALSDECYAELFGAWRMAHRPNDPAVVSQAAADVRGERR